MPIILDSRERSQYLAKHSDATRLLAYEYSGSDINSLPSYDALIIRENEPKTIKVERKRWRDLVDSWHIGKLERQLSAVDVLILELPNNEDRRLWSDIDDRALKHLARVSMNMPVVISHHDQQTMMLYRYLEKAEYLSLRQNKTVKATNDLYEDALKILGLNPNRMLRSGKLIKEEIYPLVDRWKLAEALGIGKWHNIDGLGRKAISSAAAKILKGPKLK